MKKLYFLLLLALPSMVLAQSITVASFNQNPLEVNPLLGTNLTVNIQYSSETGATSNHIYIGLEELNQNNQYVRTVSERTLQSQTAGQNLTLPVTLFVGSINPLSENLPAGHSYQIKAILYASGTWNPNATADYTNTPPLVLQNTVPYNFSTNPIHKGVDVSWMTEMESNGFVWKDNNGVPKDLMPLLSEYDINAIRLRVWVNPENSAANGWCDIEDLVDKAILSDNEGKDVMVCIHYSDHWADPGKQFKPAAWNNFTVEQLETAVYNHTEQILEALEAVNIVPKWVQIGNETNDGMLWTTGKASTGGFANYAKFINAGTNAVKTFNPTIKTILHLANGYDSNLFNWNIGGLLANNLVFSRIDIIGMSLYPEENDWIQKVDQTYTNMVNLKNTHNKDVMMVEVGFSSFRSDISYQFLVYMMEKTRQANGLGVFYWEPIAHNNWSGYDKGAWDADGSPSVAMDAFKFNATLSNESFETGTEFMVYPNPTKDILNIKSSGNIVKNIKIYDINGILLENEQVDATSYFINLSRFPIGLYFLKINDNKPIKFLKN
uniref:glycosyl hydrolase 53 family protein n=2 Tax=Flavobacterium sp. TaxID=239 RepID=UPI004049CC09